MELLTQLGWIDLVIILVLAVGVFVGFTQGLIRYALNCVAILVAFVLAAQLKGPIVGLLGFWTAFSPGGRELLVFVLLFFGFVIGGWFTIRALYRRTRLPIPRQLDELAGAVFGLLFVALLITFHLVVYDSFFRAGGQTSGWVGGYYDLLNESLIVQFFRETLLPAAGFLVRPFVPSEIAQLVGP
ncbi:MAG TPA: CvpA family protein [Candidatus Limnocylindrales bacterium]|nr:CvpA family protein [Candidatus Limnocylindrales bacterium]